MGPNLLCENATLSGIGVVEVQKLKFLFCDFRFARATLCGDRRGRGAKTRGVFCVFCGTRATLCGDRRGRGAKTRGVFLRFLRHARDPLRGSAWSRCKNSRVLAFSAARTRPSARIAFSAASRDPLRKSAWSRCKNSRLLAICDLPARPFAGIGVVEVQKLEVFWAIFDLPRDPLQGSAWSRCKNSRFLLFLLCANYVPAALAAKLQLLSTKVRSRSSSCTVATSKHERSTRSTFPQLWLQSCNFYVRK